MIQHYQFLAKLEWNKFSKNTVVILLLATYVILAPIILFSVKNIFEGAPPPFPNVESFFEFPLVWDYQGYAASWFISFNLGFIVIYIFTSEVSNKTLRQNIITGLSKKEFFTSKLLTIILLSIGATFLYYLSSIIVGLVHTPGADAELIFDNNYAGIRFFLACMGYMSFALFLSVWIKRGMLVILVFIMYVHIMEPILRQVQLYFFKSRAMIFWPMNTFEDLFPLPLYKLPDTWIEEEFGFKALQTVPEAIGLSSVYILIFLGLGWYMFDKKDV